MNKEKIKNIVLPIAIVIVVILLAYVISVITNKKDPLIKNISFEDYNEVIKKNDTNIIYIADSSKKVTRENYDILKTLSETYYLNINYLDYKEKAEEYKAFLKNEQIDAKENQMLLVVKDNKLLGKLEGSNNIETILNFIDDYVKIVNRDLINITVSEYLELIKDDELKLVYLARPTCQYCVMMTPILKGVMEEYKFNVYYINTDLMSEEDYEKLTQTAEELSEGFGTPTLIYTKDGTFIDHIEGYVERNVLVDFLKSNKIITVEK